MADDSATLSRRERNRIRTRASILKAAAHCISEAGVQAATLDQIAELADVSRTTLFNYFSNKNEIIEELARQGDPQFYEALEAWRAVDGLSTAERLLGLFATTGRYLKKTSPVERNMMGMSWLTWNEASGLARLKRLAAAFETVLEDGRERGDISPALDIPAAALVVSNTLLGAIQGWRLELNDEAADRLEQIARTLGEMIAPGSKLPERAPRLPQVEEQIRRRKLD